MEAKETSIDIIMQDPKFIELALKVMEMEPDINEDYLVPFEPDEEDEDTGVKIVKTRKGDYGNDIGYVPVKYVRQRLDNAFNSKWSFFIVAEHRETEPFQRWSRQDEDYVDGSNYLKCIGVMIVPGLGIRMEYGVKKVFGDAESTDWKACKTDAFKKCAEAFGIYLNYADDDEDEDNNSGSRGSRGKKGKKLDLSDLEYSDEDLDDALEEEVGFGKYKGYTLKEIMEEDDSSYVEWLAENANDDDMKFFASVVLKYYEEQQEEKSSRRSKGRGGKSSGSGRGKSSSKGRGKTRSKNEDEEDYMNPPEDDDEEEKSSRRSSRSGRNSSSNKGRGKSKTSDDDDDEKDELIESCRAELDNYDKVQARSMLTSVSVSNKYPKGKTKLETFTVAELRELAEVLGIE